MSGIAKIRAVALHAALSASLLCPPVYAAPSVEARALTEAFFSEERLNGLKKSIARTYAKRYSKLLLKKSVKIVDQERFAELLSDKTDEKWIQLVQDRMSGTCFNRFSAESLRVSADQFRKDPEGLQSTDESLQRTLSQVGLAAWACYVAIVAKLGAEIAQDPGISLKNNGHKIADILAIDGIATFPNRVLRNTILGELRSSDQ